MFKLKLQKDKRGEMARSSSSLNLETAIGRPKLEAKTTTVSYFKQ